MLIKVQELKKNKPIQYVIGNVNFFGMKFFLNQKVFIPRPETEELVHWIIKNHNHQKNIQVFDLCTGSGCIGITLKKKLKSIRKIYAIDCSNDALSIAYKNSKLNHVNVNFMKVNIIKNIDSIPDSIIHQNIITNIIVCNPPYIKISNKKFLHPRIIQYEPSHALFVLDKDPIIFYKKIADWIQNKFLGIVYVYFEINQEFYSKIFFLLKKKRFYNIKIKKDFQGFFRMISAQYKCKIKKNEKNKK